MLVVLTCLIYRSRCRVTINSQSNPMCVEVYLYVCYHFKLMIYTWCVLCFMGYFNTCLKHDANICFCFTILFSIYRLKDCAVTFVAPSFMIDRFYAGYSRIRESICLIDFGCCVCLCASSSSHTHVMGKHLQARCEVG